MAVRLLAYEVADLCLGKPPLRSLSISATVADALSALKSSSNTCLSVWTCDHSKFTAEECRCVRKVIDVIFYLCKDENLSSPSSALKSPVSVLLPKLPGLVRHVEPSSSQTKLSSLKELILHGNNLIGSIPKEIGMLKYLKVLDLGNNQPSGNLQSNGLTGKLPSELGNFKYLEELQLDRNKLQGNVPATNSSDFTSSMHGIVDGGRPSSASIFVGGFVLGGIVVGALGCIYAPQISKALAGADRKD
ncbi:unnamed protein product [Camellia sinensis]